MATDVTIIPKERIALLRFPRQPLSMSDSDRQQLRTMLHQATRLGNGEHGKCRIVFEDDEGRKAVETTVWTYDQENIVLKYGMSIPLARVLSISFP